MAPKSRRKARLPHPSGPAHHSARERILATASELFYQEGSRAVGIDTVIAESGVAKMSLYRSFRSKDELIGAWLEERNRLYWVWFDTIVEQHPGKPREQVRAVIRATAARTVKTGYRGCPFLNTALDYVQARHPGHQDAPCNRQWTIRELVQSASARRNRDGKSDDRPERRGSRDHRGQEYGAGDWSKLPRPPFQPGDAREGARCRAGSVVS